MARTPITVLDALVNSINVAITETTGDAVNNHSVAPAGSDVMVFFENNHSSSETITVKGVASGIHTAVDRDLAVAAGVIGCTGKLPQQLYVQSDGTIHIDSAALTAAKLWAIRVRG